MITTPGRLMLQQILPEKYQDFQKPIDSKAMTNILTDMAKTLKPDEYVDTLKALTDLGRQVGTDYGRTASFSLNDFKAPNVVSVEREKLRMKLNSIAQSDMLNAEEKRAAMEEALNKSAENLRIKLLEEGSKNGNPLLESIVSGARGGVKGERMVQQMLLGSLGSYDSNGEYIPGSGLRGFGEGQNPMEYWSSAYGTRKSNTDVQLATAKVGYLARQLTNAAHRVVVTMPDCGTSRGLRVDGDDPDNVGTILVSDVGDLKAGTLIKDEHLPALAGKKIIVRSPLSCDAAEGVCAICAGVREHGKFPGVGEAVGINATRSFVEPMTQTAIGSKHVGKQISNRKTLTGYNLINQFVQMPQEFIDSATLSKKDGVVTKLEKAPQGGMFIYVAGEKHHIPEGIALKVKKGDHVEAGDVLCDGIPNPSEVVMYKGLGEGRRYFANQLRAILKENNCGTNRRNIELFTKGFLSKAKITDPEGYAGRMLDDVSEYDSLAAAWEPRPDSSLKTITTAHNLYLERPYLHYSIGTRVTPKVADELASAGIKTVQVHKKPPPFEPFTIRAQDFLSADEDWSVRLAGEKLKSSTIAAAQRGSLSEVNSTSYFPTLLNIAEKTGE